MYVLSTIFNVVKSCVLDWFNIIHSIWVPPGSQRCKWTFPLTTLHRFWRQFIAHRVSAHVTGNIFFYWECFYYLNSARDEIPCIVARPIVWRTSQQSTKHKSGACWNTKHVCELNVPCEGVRHKIEILLYLHPIQRCLLNFYLGMLKLPIKPNAFHFPTPQLHNSSCSHLLLGFHRAVRVEIKAEF